MQPASGPVPPVPVGALGPLEVVVVQSELVGVGGATEVVGAGGAAVEVVQSQSPSFEIG